jgi:hypothetical protein
MDGHDQERVDAAIAKRVRKQERRLGLGDEQ